MLKNINLSSNSFFPSYIWCSQGHAALEAEIFGDDIYADSPLQDSEQGAGSTGAYPPAAREVVMWWMQASII